jgi:hypothetical protein
MKVELLSKLSISFYFIPFLKVISSLIKNVKKEVKPAGEDYHVLQSRHDKSNVSTYGIWGRP